MKPLSLHPNRVLLNLLIFSLAIIAIPPASADTPMRLPQFTVAGKFSDLVCAARFRFHIPGARLKALVLRSIPASWKKLGIAPGDWIVAVDGRPVAGQSLRELCLSLTQKLKAKRFTLDLAVLKKGAAEPIYLRAEFEKDSDNFTVAYP